MLRTPKALKASCACGTCGVCTDPITANVAVLRSSLEEPDDDRLGGRMVAVPARLSAPMLPPLPKPPARPVDVDGFTADMNNLINKVWPSRADDGQGRQ